MNIHIVELTPEQAIMIGAGILAMYYNQEGDHITSMQPSELIDAAVILDEVCLMLPVQITQLRKHFNRVADMMRNAAAYLTNSGLS